MKSVAHFDGDEWYHCLCRFFLDNLNLIPIDRIPLILILMIIIIFMIYSFWAPSLWLQSDVILWCKATWIMLRRESHFIRGIMIWSGLRSIWIKQIYTMTKCHVIHVHAKLSQTCHTNKIIAYCYYNCWFMLVKIGIKL